MGWEVLQLGNGVFGVLGKGVLGFGERGLVILGICGWGFWGFGVLGVGVLWRCARRGFSFLRIFIFFMRLLSFFMRVFNARPRLGTFVSCVFYRPRVRVFRSFGEIARTRRKNTVFRQV
jgi:hypothetical protein